ncbi:hypothetical protein L2649_12925 [Thermoactinomyces vulgaris]|uniref:hypothetical protein n=1 Tax=Thermoactinomyces TaxID=2023 RepID=UPI00103DB0C2|nr:hypothetical protein [Thermoactinomyces vulgaris]MCF6136057.1 hypothetical protein [Thermoactinomyces vulgaris]QBK12722.1 hypothetical protein AB849_003165 [Thermoactinomyces vulgaris]
MLESTVFFMGSALWRCNEKFPFSAKDKEENHTDYDHEKSGGKTMNGFPYFECQLPIYTEKDIHETDIHEIAEMISNQLFGGLPFGGLEDYIYKEIPAIYIDSPILGFEIIVAGFNEEDWELLIGDEERYYFLDIVNYPILDSAINRTKGVIRGENLYITGYVANLLKGTEGIEIRDKILEEDGYIDLDIDEEETHPDNLSAKQKIKNKFPYFICHLPFNSDKDLHEVGRIISKALCGGLPFNLLKNEQGPVLQLERTILGLQIKILQEEKGYCLEIKNDPDTIPDGVDTVNVDITRFIALSLEESIVFVKTEGVDIDYDSIHKEFVKIG